MFGFLKDKIKSALGKFTKEVEKDAVVEQKEVIVEKKLENKKDKEKITKKEVPVKKQPVPISKPKPVEIKKKEDKKPIIISKTVAKPQVAVKPVQVVKPTPKVEVKNDIKKTKPISTSNSQSEKEIKPTETKEVKKEIVSETKIKEIKSEPVPEKKKGFFERIFSRTESKKEEDEIESREELRTIAEQTDIEPVDAKHIEEALEENEDVQVKEVKTEEELESEETVQEQIEVVQTEEESQEEVEETTTEIEQEELEEETEEIKDEEKSEVEQKDIIIEKSKSEIKQDTSIKSRNKILEEERNKKTVEQKEESKGFFSKITETFTKIQISDEKFEELFWDLEIAMLENGVAVEVIDKIKRDLKKELMAGKVSRSGVEEIIASTLKKSITELFDVEKINLVERIKSKKDKPYIISIIGVNGSGKTTSIAKLTHKLQKEGLSIVLAASDTFRAAAIQQLEEHANNLNVKLIKHDYNSDPAAVAFDAINYAKAKNIDVVIIDTAGRLHSNTNLMRELEKIIRVCKPDIKIFVGESITGNDCVEQAKEFDNAVGIDAIILAKADVDDKGGAAISVSYILQRPILYLGTGQTYDDLKDFDSQIIIDGLGL